MSGWLEFDRLAAARGDGLDPALRAVLREREALARDPAVAEMARYCHGPVQAGPNPAPRPDAFVVTGNVVPAAHRFIDASIERKNACTSR